MWDDTGIFSGALYSTSASHCIGNYLAASWGSGALFCFRCVAFLLFTDSNMKYTLRT